MYKTDKKKAKLRLLAPNYIYFQYCDSIIGLFAISSFKILLLILFALFKISVLCSL